MFNAVGMKIGYDDYPRAAPDKPEPIVVPGVDTIVASSVSTAIGPFVLFGGPNDRARSLLPAADGRASERTPGLVPRSKDGSVTGHSPRGQPHCSSQ
jgi:hypothetical protein